MQKLDKTIVGAIFGAIFPIITFLIYWKLNHTGTFETYISFLSASAANRNNPLVFAMIPNLVLFYLTNFQLKLNNFTVGLVGATLFYTIPIVISLIL